MNNKGQTLVVFVLVLPLIMLIIAGIVEIGRLTIIKSEYEQSITDAISYGLDNIDQDNTKEKMAMLLDENIDCFKEISISDGKITVHVSGNIDGMFSKMFKKQYYIDLSYKGYISSGKKKIVKD